VSRTSNSSLTHKLRRISQTPTTFSNWPALLSNMALEGVGRGGDVLHFQARSGLRIDSPNVPGARVPVYEIFAEDCYHLEWFLGELLHQPIQVVDIGAHIGTFACRLGQLNTQARIDCFEPSPTTASFLRRNVEQNGMAARITVHEAAVAAKSGFAELDDNGGGSGLNGLVSAGHSSGRASTRVTAVAFDEAWAELASPPSVVKIDCEGGEYDLVYGSSPELWDSVRRVVLEYHSVPGETWAKLRSWFEDRGLHVVEELAGTMDGLGSAWLSRDPIAPRR